MMSLAFKSIILIIALQDVTTVLAKPTKTPPIHIIDKMQPLYELQMAVWPTDVDDIVETVTAVMGDVSTMHPLVEQPIAVMPDMDYTQDDELMHDEVDEEDVDDHDQVVNDPIVDVGSDPVIVLENYHKTYANGSEEYKLVLSNGMVNYQHIDHVMIKGVKRPVQEGFYTVPMEGARMTYQTVYYRADINGYNVYKTEDSPRNPAYDLYLQYTKDQEAKIQ